MTDSLSLAQAFGIAQTLLLMVCGWLYSSAVRRMGELEASIAKLDERVTGHGERLAALDAQRSDFGRRLDRIEGKLDALIQLGGTAPRRVTRGSGE